MKKIRIAQIGTSENSHGNAVFHSLKKQSDIFEVAGFALPEHEREKFSREMGEFEGYREMTVEEILNDHSIEAVAVETEELYLTKYALMAAEHGKHIHMEKPGGVGLADFTRLIERVRRNGTVFHTGYMYRYNPEIQRLFSRIEAGDLGEIVSVEAQMNCYHGDAIRKWMECLPGGMMFFLGCHLVDLVLRLMGQPEEIIPFNMSTGLGGIPSVDFGMAVFRYPRGISFIKAADVETGGYAMRQLVVAGTKGTVEIKPLEMLEGNVECDGQFAESCTYRTPGNWLDRGEKHVSPLFDRYDGMLRAFAEYVSGSRQNPYTLDYELKLYKTVLQCCGVIDKGDCVHHESNTNQ